MIKKYDVVEITWGNIVQSGLAKGSEHHVAYACNECGIVGVIVGTEEKEGIMIYVPIKYIKVIGKTNSNITRRYIDDIENKHNLWKCKHD